MPKVIPVVGGQFGSEGKGSIVHHITRRLAREAEAQNRPGPLVIRTGGPNAGHTAYDDHAQPWALRQVPVGVLTPSAQLHIAAGSEIEEQVLNEETSRLESMGFDVRDRLTIDSSVTMLERQHHEREEELHLQAQIGSTQKGVGAARADRIMRHAKTAGRSLLYWRMANTADVIAVQLRAWGDVVIETSQGYGLGLHGPFYPFATSIDCTAIDALAACRVSPWGWTADIEVRPVVVLRTFPIRVAGNSGPLRNERSWDELSAMSNGHIKPEQTTVTKKTRRVGSWDSELAAAAVRANGGPNVDVALTFFDYLYTGCFNEDEPQKLPGAAYSTIYTFESQIGARITMLGTGPRTVIDLPPAQKPIAYVEPPPMVPA